VSVDYRHDPDLLDALEAMEPRSFYGVAWRVTWATRDPLAGGTGGGRWHPPNDFEALYTSLDEHGAVAEIYHHLSQAPVFSSSHVKINELSVRSERTLVFDDIPALAAVGVDEQAFRSGDTTRTREIGAAARFLDLDGIMVPSARWPCANLVLFLDRLPDLDMLKVVNTRDINWPAWRERLSPPGPAKGLARH
jgi:RES domain-containing protein